MDYKQWLRNDRAAKHLLAQQMSQAELNTLDNEAFLDAYLEVRNAFLEETMTDEELDAEYQRLWND